MAITKGVYFVSGIDTDAGKSYVTGVLAARAKERGINVITQKFIQTGGLGDRGVSIDIDVHRRIMGIDLLPEDVDGTTCPVVFSYPASPYLASTIDKKEIDFDAIARSIRQLSAKYELLFIEGAGGLHVPLNERITTIDYIQNSGLPLILVTSGKLGSVNHTLLSLEVCRNRGIEVAALAYNRYFGTDKVIDEDTFKYLSDYLEKYHPDCEMIEVGTVNL
ncbi:MAG TPA: ATP-dependent dethiobiotin synthetase BioD [Candidatus Avirikenella pullistercoris]|nr:ATP-dependent dethiobiotin synthetase BioD [Candidatus Avirikenella pullistercoris]